MSKKKKKLPEGYLAVHRPLFLQQLLALVWFVPGTVIVLGMFVTGIGLKPGYLISYICGGLISLAFFGIPAWHSFWVLTRNKLVIRTNGLEWWYSGEHNAVTWNELEVWDRKSYIWAGASHFGIYSEDGKFIPIDHYLAMPEKKIWNGRYLPALKQFYQTEAGSQINRHAPFLLSNLS